MMHELKTWPEPFEAISQGVKPYEIRIFDRPFSVGDSLILRRFENENQEHTGEFITAIITYVTKPGEWGLPSGQVGVFGFKKTGSGFGEIQLINIRSILKGLE